MKVIYEKLPSKPEKSVATLGVFDSLHKGHQLILRRLKAEAKRCKLPALLITFDKHPRILLKKHFNGYILSSAEKYRLVDQMKIDYLWILKTTPCFLRLSGKDFVLKILKTYNIKKFIVGDDFAFGAGRQHDIGHLRDFGRQYGFSITVVKKKRIDKKIVSSSIVREYILKADLKKAKKFLGRSYCFEGKVVKGKGVGKRLGFPTANIKAGDLVIPPSGVYSAYTMLGKKRYLSAVNIERDLIETHLINFHGNLHNKTLKIVFIKRIRQEKIFKTHKQLQKAIARDVEQICKDPPRRVRLKK